jgi:hypothetical protein
MLDDLSTSSPFTEGDPALSFLSDESPLLDMDDSDGSVDDEDSESFDVEPVCPRCSGPFFEYDRECKAHVCDGCGLWLDDTPLDDWDL